MPKKSKAVVPVEPLSEITETMPENINNNELMENIKKLRTELKADRKDISKKLKLLREAEAMLFKEEK